MDDPLEGVISFCDEPGREVGSGGSVGGCWCCMVPGGGGAGGYCPTIGKGGPCPYTIACGGGPPEVKEGMVP